MAAKTGIIFFTLLLGSLAVPVPEEDLSIFFPETRESRIVGGNLAAEGAHPWMVGLTAFTTVTVFGGGGSIINQRTVLTAAHCIVPFVFDGVLMDSFRLVVGQTNWNSGHGQSYSGSSFVIHPQYDRPTIKYDIGVIISSTNIVFSNTVHPISLGFDFVGEGVWARVAGWGGEIPHGPIVAHLREVELPTIDMTQCANAVRQAGIDLNIIVPPIDSRIELCTFRQFGKGTCGGDSGSALVRIDRGLQIGIVSWGFPCGIGMPDVFARVSAFQTWIVQHAQN